MLVSRALRNMKSPVLSDDGFVAWLAKNPLKVDYTVEMVRVGCNTCCAVDHYYGVDGRMLWHRCRWCCRLCRVLVY